MDFDSHTSGVVLAAVDAINIVTPGRAYGRDYRPPAGRALVEAVRAAVYLDPRSNRAGRVAEPITAADLAEFGRHLADLRAVFVAVAAGDLDGACVRTNRLLRSTAATPMLAHHDDEPWHLHYHAIDAPWATGTAGSMATALAIVLGSPDHDRLGVCRAPGCDRVYVDTSRNGTRRFCSTACQNRVKAAAFRERRKS